MPDTRLVYLVRDPVDRALSQYAHHVREGDEQRPVSDALLDPDSQYVSRGRYFERLEPFLARFAREQVHVVVQERLLSQRRRELRRVYQHIGADGGWWSDELERRWHVGTGHRDLPPGVAQSLREAVADDVERLSELIGDDLPEWSARSPEMAVGQHG